MPSKEYIKGYQALIDSGNAWTLEGAIGREAMELIHGGYCMLGKVGQRDFYGNYVPSRFEVKKGTEGSRAYATKMTNERESNA